MIQTRSQTNKNPLTTDHLKVGLKARSIKNALIVGVSQGGRFILQFVAMVAMARLLAPSDFGVFGIAMATTAFGLMFKDGFGIGTIQRDSLTQDQCSGVFWINVAVGLTLTAVTCGAAPIVAHFYQQPVLMPLLIAMSSTFVFSYLGSQQLAVLKRQMRFGAIGVIDQLSMFLSVTAGIVCAWLGWGVWALAIVQIGLSLFSCVGAWVASGWRPDWFKRNCGLGALMLYGKDLATADLASYVTRNVDNLLIGWSCGVGPLGFYDRAYTLMMVPLQQLLTPLGGVAHTMLSRLQKEREVYLEYAQNMISIGAGLGMPVGAYLFVGAPRFIPVVLGEKWLGSVTILQALAPGAFIDSFIMTITVLLLSSGRTRQYLSYRICAAVLAVVAFFAGVHWGPTGVAVGVSISRFIAAATAVYLCCSTTESPVRWSHIWRSASSPCLASIGASAIVLLGDHVIANHGGAIVSLILNALAFAVLYLGIWAVLPGGARTIGQIVAWRFKRRASENEQAEPHSAVVESPATAQ